MEGGARPRGKERPIRYSSRSRVAVIRIDLESLMGGASVSEGQRGAIVGPSYRSAGDEDGEELRYVTLNASVDCGASEITSRGV